MGGGGGLYPLLKNIPSYNNKIICNIPYVNGKCGNNIYTQY